MATNRRGPSIRGVLRGAWRILVDLAEWSSNGDRRRPKFAERSDIYDPTAGYGPGGETNEALDAERRGDRD
jgi:hypothetical protein